MVKMLSKYLLNVIIIKAIKYHLPRMYVSKLICRK